MSFTLSINDFVIIFFVAGVTTLPPTLVFLASRFAPDVLKGRG